MEAFVDERRFFQLVREISGEHTYLAEVIAGKGVYQKVISIPAIDEIGSGPFVN